MEVDENDLGSEGSSAAQDHAEEVPVPPQGGVAIELGTRPDQFSEIVWNQLLAIDLDLELSTSISTLDECPAFMRSALRTSHTLALQRLRTGYQTRDEMKVQQGWVLFILISRMLLSRPERQGTEGEAVLRNRVQRFNEGQWTDLLREARQQSPRSRQQGRTGGQAEQMEARLQRACDEVHRGNPSRARQALTASAVAPGTEETWREPADPVRRPPQLQRPLPQAVFEDSTAFPPLRLDLQRFFSVVRSAKKGTAAPRVSI